MSHRGASNTFVLIITFGESLYHITIRTHRRTKAATAVVAVTAFHIYYLAFLLCDVSELSPH